MMVIDTNTLLLYILGLLANGKPIEHKRASMFNSDDFRNLLRIIKKPQDLLVISNVWSEVDNFLNNFNSFKKVEYYLLLKKLIVESNEDYLKTIEIVYQPKFPLLGITDSLLLEFSKKTGTLITVDFELAGIARKSNIVVHNLIEMRQDKIFNKFQL